MQSLLTGAVVSLLFTLFLTPLFIRLFHRLQWGQFIRDDGPVSHHAKRGTATMGGVVFIIASVVDDRPRGQTLGAAVQLLKPVSRDDLMGALKRVGVHGKVASGG